MDEFEEICHVFESRQIFLFKEACEKLVRVAAQGLSLDHTARLATALAASSNPIVLPAELAPFGDVPSTGAPGSLSTLLCPILLRTVGITVPKISASGSVAGAIDALELIPGFRSALKENEFIEALRTTRFAHTSQTSDFCLADRHLIDARRAANMMANPALAISSLLSKKLAVPGTTGVFDFRIGSTGNIATDIADARTIAQEFLKVAHILGLSVGICLTDNRTPPSSAFGRFESLSLLCDFLRGHCAILELDRRHLDLCVTIAAVAADVATGLSDTYEREGDVKEAIRTGRAWTCFLDHLKTQGADEDALLSTLGAKSGFQTHHVKAWQEGYWHPPDLLQLKNWLKSKGGKSGVLALAHQQIGIRLLVDPGTLVKVPQNLIRLRMPSDAELRDSDLETIRGMILSHPFTPNAHLIEIMK